MLLRSTPPRTLSRSASKLGLHLTDAEASGVAAFVQRGCAALTGENQGTGQTRESSLLADERSVFLQALFKGPRELATNIPLEALAAGARTHGHLRRDLPEIALRGRPVVGEQQDHGRTGTHGNRHRPMVNRPTEVDLESGILGAEFSAALAKANKPIRMAIEELVRDLFSERFPVGAKLFTPSQALLP
jgi:hypothetical protein